MNKELKYVRKKLVYPFFLQSVSTLGIEIDRLVYELYGLTEEEIKIVEGE